MNLAIAASVFGLIALAELPDKTMIATIVMGSRGRPLPIWLGGTVAFGIHAALAVVAGRFLQLLPHRTLEIVLAVIFGAGALYLLGIPEKDQVQKGTKEGTTFAEARQSSSFRVGLGAFGVILFGEMGDLTQVLLANLEARYKSPVSVFVGGFLALAAVAGVASFGGRALLRVLPLQTIRRMGGLALLGFCAYAVSTLVG